MPISRAYKLCPEYVFPLVRMEVYKGVSSRVLAILRGFSEKFEQVSVDEAYLTPFYLHSFEEAVICARKIKDEIKDKGN
jgi:DNA polymerase IV (archaeal DinB-like DNA polymerase)